MNKVLPKEYNFLIPCPQQTLLRMGVNKDGGYIVNEKLINNSNILISFGMGDEFSFENDFLKKNEKNKVFIFDYSINHKIYIKNILKIIRRILKFKRRYSDLIMILNTFKNFRKFINKDKVKFFSKKITNNVINKNDINLKKIFELLKINKKENINLKIDIEGDEYKIIDDILIYNDKISQIVMEFHDTHTKKEEFFKSVKKLQKFFTIVHLHANNYNKCNNDGFPINIEITFCKNKYLTQTQDRLYNFPIKNLDYPNNSTLPDIEINFQENGSFS